MNIIGSNHREGTFIVKMTEAQLRALLALADRFTPDADIYTTLQIKGLEPTVDDADWQTTFDFILAAGTGKAIVQTTTTEIVNITAQRLAQLSVDISVPKPDGGS